MPVEVIMPKVDMDMTTGRIAQWHKAEGESVDKDEALFDIETDKATMEVESPAAGTLQHILVGEGGESLIGEPVAYIYSAGEEVDEAPRKAPAANGQAEAPPRQRDPAATSPPQTRSPPPEPQLDKPRATPLAKRTARQHGLDLATIEGSGARGRITRADVDAHLEHDPAEASLGSAPSPAAPQAAPPLVLIHGFANDRSGWSALERALPKSARTVALELPGHGAVPAGRIAAFADLLDDVRPRFEAAAAEPVHLVGHSLGGAVALALGDALPRRVARLTLIAPAGLGPEIDGAVLAGLARASKAESLAPWLKRLVADPDAISWNYVQSVLAARRDPGLREAQADLAAAVFPDGTQAFDLTEELRRVAPPTRIVWGRADRVIPWRHALAAPGRVALHLFDGVGHLPHVEAAAEVAALLAQD